MTTTTTTQSTNRRIDESKNSRAGFTIIELLVASLLLGMLMTILTMIFSQSSIAWRTGMAGVADLDTVRTKVSDVRYEADNAYVWKGQVKCVRSVFDDSGELRTDRQIADFDNGVKGIKSSVSDTSAQDSFQSDVGCGSGTGSSSKDYIVNVMSCGPDRNDKTLYDNIYVLPTDPTTWRE